MRGISAFTRALIEIARKILKDDHPQTLRQLHYRIFSLALSGYKNDRASYRGLCRVLTNARRLYRQWELSRKDWTPFDHENVIQAKRFLVDSGLEHYAASLESPDLGIPSNWIVDELRLGERVNVWEDAPAYVEAVEVSYRRDNWQDQPRYVELWGEKATVLGALRPIANAWGLMLRVCRGFGSAGMEDQVGRLFEGIEKDITVFYVGDHDASGVLIERDMHRRVQTASGADFEMVRLAIHASDIPQFNLPPQQIKDADVRASAFRREFGADASTVELEALPVTELKRRIVEAVTGLIDFDLWDRQVEIQNVELSCIAEFAERMKYLPQLGGGAA